jgi:hypothetical protein
MSMLLMRVVLLVMSVAFLGAGGMMVFAKPIGHDLRCERAGAGAATCRYERLGSGEPGREFPAAAVRASVVSAGGKSSYDLRLDAPDQRSAIRIGGSHAQAQSDLKAFNRFVRDPEVPHLHVHRPTADWLRLVGVPFLAGGALLLYAAAFARPVKDAEAEVETSGATPSRLPQLYAGRRRW